MFFSSTYIVLFFLELLESLKKESAAPRERPGTSEMTSLKSKLAERDETVKTLKEKNVRYKTMIEELRGKVVELTKDLSLAEVKKL
jgi:predicted RNase H-like nuclease (RuvC/YqgF family)